MARIKIKNLPADYKITKEELKKIKGGVLTTTSFQTSFSSIDWGNINPVIGGYCRDGSSKPAD
ncbi:MAG: hypothetical protein JRG97_11450 [Deltaproteobacteria bacterium]|nr:hypothetical protein [Deltaproteobacteria bacterium]MBW2053035.1 hypothetical protein [Deltaproteobacteria bacterium]MBW2141668.1 hypothetical protein [Deltaproteobacteria bacterium]MBW2323186.1 hypothetical protein [Deltaproteobacteria bacterium]